MTKRRAIEARFWIAIGALLLLSACGQGTDNAAGPGAADIETGVLYRGNGGEPDTLDPQQASGTWENNIIGDMVIGLTTEGPDGAPIPGAAESWDTSEDGLTWTFHLRDHQWSDGVPVTADDFVYAWRRILDPSTAARYAYFLYPIKNAEAVNNGSLPTTELGVSAPDERTLVVELEHPAPYLEQFMTHYATYPVPRHAVEQLGNTWTRAGNYVVNGPYTLVEWIPNDHVTLEKNPLFYDAENVVIDRVVFYPTSDYEAALRRFRAGELDTQDRLPQSQIDWLRQNMPEALEMAPILVTEYFAMNESRPPLDDVRVREALSLALNREMLTDQVMRVGHRPSYSIVPPDIANYPGGEELSFKSMPYAQRIERAQMLMREAGFGPDNRLSTTLSIRSASADARRVPAAVQQMWREIYVDVEIEQSDVAVFYNNIREHDFDIAAAGWSADFNDAENFLYLLRTGNEDNSGLYSNPAFDSLLDLATAEPDLEKRGQLLAQAERIALDDHAWIPFFSWVSQNLVHTYVKGWSHDARDVHRTRWMSIDEEARAEMFPNRY